MLETMDLDGIEVARIRPLKRTDFDRLVELGSFGQDERVELVRGLLLRMTPIGPGHAWSVDQLTELLGEALRGRASLRVQASFALSDDSEPQPDLFIYPRGDFRKAHPSCALLVIEVSESSLHFDRTTKRALYAETGVPEYWIVNLVDHVVEVFDRPEGREYERRRVFGRGESVSPGAFPDVSVAVDRVVP